VGAEYCSSVCLDAATEAAEARREAAHQAQRDRDREPDRWPTGTRQRCPWCGDHFRSPGYPSVDGLEVYCSPGCKRAAWHDDADGTAGPGRRAEAPTEPEPVTWAERVRAQLQEGVRAALAEECPF
jgi:hypothetical protein